MDSQRAVSRDSGPGFGSGISTSRGSHGLVDHRCIAGGRVVHLALTLRRWLLALAVLACLVSSGGAWAFGQVGKTAQQVTTWNCSGYVGASAVESCQLYADAQAAGALTQGWASWSHGAVSCDANNACTWPISRCLPNGECYSASSGTGTTPTTTENQACPPFSTEQSNGSCTCDGGFEPDGPTACKQSGSCQTVVDAMNGLGGSYIGTGSAGSLSFCFAGCVIEGEGSAGPPGGATREYYGPFTTKGANCSGQGQSGSDAQKDPQPCPPKQCHGTVNGAAVCVACGDTSSKGPSGGTTNPGGPGSPGGPRLDPNAPDGADGKSEKTTCTGAQCTTTTTYTCGGVECGQRTETKDEKTFCAENPNLAICKDSTISGACDAVQCAGDAVQCAIAREQAKRNCEFFGEATAGTAINAKNAGLLPGDHPRAVGAGMGLDLSSRIDQTDALGGGGCPADVVTTVMGQTVTLSFASLCSAAAIAGQALVGFSLLIAALIVFKGN